MRAVERHTRILEILAEDGKLSVNDLASSLGVSVATVRRDLDQLEKQGLLIRMHGGAVAHRITYELPLRFKRVKYREEKRRIAQAAASLLSGGEAIGLTGGTTTAEVARALVEKADLTIVTTAVNIAAELAVRPNLRVLIPGGIVRSRSYEIAGPLAEATLRTLNLDIAFIGVDGISPEAGLTTYDVVEASTNRVMIQQARRVVVVADHSKIGRVTFAQICGLDCVDTFITDTGADPAIVDQLREAGLKVWLV